MNAGLLAARLVLAAVFGRIASAMAAGPDGVRALAATLLARDAAGLAQPPGWPSCGLPPPRAPWR